MTMAETLLPAAENPFLDNDLARYLPAPKAETWRMSTVRPLKEAETAEIDRLQDIDIERILPVLQGDVLVMAGGKVTAGMGGVNEGLAASKTGGYAGVSYGYEADKRRRGELTPDKGTLPLAPLGQVADAWRGGEPDRVRVFCDKKCQLLHVVHVLPKRGAPISDLLDIEVADGGELTLIEHFVGLADSTAWMNAARHVRVATGGKLTHGVVQNLPFTALLTLTQGVMMADSADYSLQIIQNGACFARVESDIVCGAEVALDLQAVQHVKTGQTHDVTTRVRFNGPAPRASVTQRNLVEGGGLSVFQGKYHVAQAAQKTDAYMRCENLLLDDRAVVNQKPELEIYADDVKCSHGASTGGLSDEQLFYLKARGLPEEVARGLLVEAFMAAGRERMHDLMKEAT
ncbi:MAG: hypothetical protein COY40_01625 [Alphaproteobacteria bacterium CG_4_10_14_0_8_um_filter_53_9]|nr:MAG: hypothetical protein COY40_01625 [Alphaproteobacteria bacterium CG_4_10_14_0_8_um_filter_53_9]